MNRINLIFAFAIASASAAQAPQNEIKRHDIVHVLDTTGIDPTTFCRVDNIGFPKHAPAKKYFVICTSSVPIELQRENLEFVRRPTPWKKIKSALHLKK